MNDRQLRSFIKTVECGSFAKAEEERFLSRQALKKQIDALEEELGFLLLVRTHHGVELTPAGEEFCKGISAILDETDELIHRCKNFTSNGDIIRISSPYHPRLLLEKTFSEFYRKYPEIKQQVMLESPAQALDSILKGEVDVAEYIYKPFLDTMDINYINMFPLPYKCLMVAGHSLAKKKQPDN